MTALTRRKLLLIGAAALAACVALVQPTWADTRTQVQTDNFNRAGTSLGSNWAQLNPGSCRVDLIASTYVEGSHYAGAIAESGAARWVGSGSFSDDQYSEITLSNVGSSSSSTYMGVIIRASGDTDSAADFYAGFYIDDGSGSWKLGKVVNGSWTQLASGTSSWSNSDKISVTAIGTALKLYQNTSQLASVTDSALSTGKPGVFANVPSAVRGDNWEGGDVTAGGGASIGSRMMLLGVGP